MERVEFSLPEVSLGGLPKLGKLRLGLDSNGRKKKKKRNSYKLQLKRMRRFFS